MSRGRRQRVEDILDCVQRAKSAEIVLAQAEHDNNQALIEMAYDAILYNLLIFRQTYCLG